MVRLAGLVGWFGLAQPVQAATNQDASVAVNAPVYTRVLTPYGNVLTAQDVSILMRDGVMISLDIYRPDDNTVHPSLYAAGPYPHPPSLLNDSTSEVGPVAWYVSQGYAVVVASVRGTGKSGGDFTFLARQEQQDHYEIVQWIGEQPWSDDQVAGTGAGYYAASQWHAAIQNPPGLTCIAPINGTLDPLREWVMPGGMANNDFLTGWYEDRVRIPNAYSATSPRLINFDLRLLQLTHPLTDSWWEDRSSYSSTRLINVPIFAINDWNLDKSVAGMTTSLNALGRLNVVNKVLISGAPGDLPIYQDTAFLARELLPYYQWCFTGKNPSSAYIEQPRVRYQVRGQNIIKRDSNWPPGNITQQSRFLNMPAGSSFVGDLDISQNSGGTGFSNLDRTDANAALRFVSGRLAQDMEITGPVMLELYAASTTNDMAFEVTIKEEMVFEVPATGFLQPDFRFEEAESAPLTTIETSTELLVSRGALKASMRQREANRSTEYQPVYALQGAEQLSPGQVYRMDIALRQTAYRFRAGNRLVLEIQPVNDGSLSALGRDTVYFSNRYPSRIWLPVVQSPLFSAPRPAASAPANNTNLPNRLPPLNNGQQPPPGSIPPGPAQGNAQDSPDFFIPQ